MNHYLKVFMENRSHFDTAAKTWDNEETIKRNEAFAQAIKKHLTNHVAKVMDFGCGTGLLTSHFLNVADELIGIETSSGMLEQFSERFKDISRVKSIAINLETESLPSDVGTFDLIVTAMAFHHLKDPKAVLSLFKNHLKPNGMVFVIDLDEEDGTFHPDNQGMGVHHFGFSKNTMESWSQELGYHSFRHEIVYEMFKNDRSYGIGMGVFCL
jgi:ubiquinone/menaquinone biosynthesis C-methylase UbiE